MIKSSWFYVKFKYNEKVRPHAGFTSGLQACVKVEVKYVSSQCNCANTQFLMPFA